MFVRLLLALMFVTVSQHAAALDENDRGTLDVWVEDLNNFSMIYFGREGSLLQRGEIVGQCKHRAKIGVDQARELGLTLGVSQLAEAGLVDKQADAVRIIEKTDPSLRDLEDLISLNCVTYWTNQQSKSSFLKNRVYVERAISRLLRQNDRVVFLVDSPAKTYKSGITRYGETNADEIHEHLLYAGIEANILSANAHPNWSRTDEILAREPELVILHFSAFERVDQEELLQPCSFTATLENHCMHTTANFISEVLESGSSVILYTRTATVCDQGNPERLTNLLTTLGVNEEDVRKVLLIRMEEDEAASFEGAWRKLAQAAKKLLAGEIELADRADPNACRLLS